MNIERPIPNIEWEKMKKHTYYMEEKLLIEGLENSTSTDFIEVGIEARIFAPHEE